MSFVISPFPKFHRVFSIFCFSAVAKLWNLKTQPGRNTVFVCTDKQLVEMDIKLGQNLIHFSLPPNWMQFSFRFSVMCDYFENFIVNNVSKNFLLFYCIALSHRNVLGFRHLNELLHFQLCCWTTMTTSYFHELSTLCSFTVSLISVTKFCISHRFDFLNFNITL